MSLERQKVLEMLAQGKITPDEAGKLLDRIGARHSTDDSEEEGGREIRTRPPKYLRVHVRSADKDQVNIRVPLSLVKTGIKLSTMLPSEANEKLSRKGIDLAQLSKMQGDELLEALRELRVDVDAADGETVRIFCE